MEKVNRVAEQFDGHAKNYDNPATAWLGERELRAVRKLAPFNSAVLDYGCGTGRTTLDLLRRGCQVTAFDVSAEMLNLARVSAQCEGHTAEFTINPEHLAGRTWPVVTCVGVLDYYHNPVPLLRHLRQYLSPGGRLIITFPNLLNPMGWAYYLSSHLTIQATPRTPASARKACQRAGLEIEESLFTLPALEPIGYTMVFKCRDSENHV